MPLATNVGDCPKVFSSSVFSSTRSIRISNVVDVKEVDDCADGEWGSILKKSLSSTLFPGEGDAATKISSNNEYYFTTYDISYRNTRNLLQIGEQLIYLTLVAV